MVKNGFTCGLFCHEFRVRAPVVVQRSISLTVGFLLRVEVAGVRLPDRVIGVLPSL